MNELDYCLKWFESEDLMAFMYDKSIYVVMGYDDYEFQISPSEVSYRADLYKSTIEEPK
tara:strand:- start:400 stop:576 length:177 start_codon:yes stop_codon:yes gene_type:complete